MLKNNHPLALIVYPIVERSMLVVNYYASSLGVC